MSIRKVCIAVKDACKDNIRADCEVSLEKKWGTPLSLASCGCRFVTFCEGTEVRRCSRHTP